MNDLMIEASDVVKAFGAQKALDGVSIAVPKGTVLGLLGHNGAGKTTLVNVLTTMLPPDRGTATVGGFDVVTQAHQVRSRIGLTGQFAAVDESLSGLDNLVLIARLLGASTREAKVRGTELLELFDLADAAKRPSRTYSGGMRRRLDLAASLVGHPEVIFLDEPTTGLDPAGRLGLWEVVEGLVTDGTTVLLTTQYLDEADRLADSITVLAQGRVVASGTSAELKAQVGQRTVTVTLADASDLPKAQGALERAGMQPVPALNTLTAPVTSSRELAVVVRALDEVGLEATELALGEPTLDDVYLTLAAHAA
ncbi:daunorubicin resistance protein DrrA family ABC transporter ATP-binding protein [Actinosynnema sp. NPDC047251]|uniref:Daunorubicin/doxorubicin resistance ATP-binding protein DrrA n=1 Tax=Saccharothrix espanaensis (strain ATCC 51144 / DSM 44229 / JCM 9112 / NBRC 15066 / NRRL 15764) TaxID=1179773 RepID=K0JV61_SACES|nr:daunorubicin resistance protein DrrA family ABC transporter ATP-binding protein [Saccharothrix espanaensis]CCH28644.1 Daunorubicin/doxorubicin resistance ATP-binding protein DrrA [Saccharothrix espanaensis DSM 44229]